MNNTVKIKKLLMVLFAVILCCALVVSVVACATETPTDDSNKDNDSEDTETLLIANGDFNNYSGDSQPYVPKNWTSANESSDKATSDYLAAGVVNLGSTYDANKATWGGVANPKKEDGDDTALVIHIKPETEERNTNTYYSYSNSFSTAIGGYYKVTVDVYVANATESGAFIRFSEAAYHLFGPIKPLATPAWQTYTFYVEASAIETDKVNVTLSMGMKGQSTTGTVFFDNAVATKIDSKTYNDAKAVGENDTTAFYSFRTPDAEFINTTDSSVLKSPADWTGSKGKGNGADASSSTSNRKSGIINTDPSVWTSEVTTYGKNPGVREGAPDTNVLLIYSYANNPTSYKYTGDRDIRVTLGHYYEVSVWVFTDLYKATGKIKEYKEVETPLTSASVGTYYTKDADKYASVTLNGTNFDEDVDYYTHKYELANDVTSETSGTYYVESEGKYTAVQLPAEYDAEATYYSRNGYVLAEDVDASTTGTYYKKLDATYTEVVLDGTADKFDEHATYYYAVREAVADKQGAWITLSGTDEYVIGEITTNGTWQKVSFIVLGNLYRNKDFSIELSLGHGGADDKDTHTYGTVAFDGLEIKDLGVITDRSALVDTINGQITSAQYNLAVVDAETEGTYYYKDGEEYVRVNFFKDGDRPSDGIQYYTKNYKLLVNLESLSGDKEDLSNELIKHANFSDVNTDAENVPEGETLGLPTGWQFDAIGDVVVEDGVDVEVSTIGKEEIQTYVLPGDADAKFVKVGNWYQEYDADNAAHAGLEQVDYDTVKAAYEKYWKDTHAVSGNPLLPYDSLAPVLVINNKAASAYEMTMSQKVVVKPNKYYRLAAWVKTMDIAENSGLNLSLTDVDSKDGKAFASFTTINTADYSNELTNDYVELTIFIQGSQLIDGNGAYDADTKEYTLSLTLGSGTQYTPDTFVKGTVFVANINMELITHTEYEAAKTGTYCKKQAVSSNSASVTNGNFNDADLEDAEINDNGQFTKVPAIDSWTNNVNDDDKEDISVGILNVNNMGALDIYADLTARGLATTDDIYNTADGNPWSEKPIDDQRTPEMISSPNLAVISTNGAATTTYGDVLTSPSITLDSNAYSAIKLYVKTVDTSATSGATSTLKAEITLDVTTYNAHPITKTVATNGKWQEVVFYVHNGIVGSASCKLTFSIGSEKDKDATYSGTILVDTVSKYTITEDEYDNAIDEISTVSFITDTFTGDEDTSKPASPNKWSGTGTTTSSTANSDNQVAGIINSQTIDDNDDMFGIRHQIAEDKEAGIEKNNEIIDGTALTKDMLFNNDVEDGTDTSELIGGAFDTANGVLVINNLNPGYYTYSTSSITLKSNSHYAINVYARTYYLDYDAKAFVTISIGDDTYTFNVNTSDYTWAEDADGDFVIVDGEYVRYNKDKHASLARYTATEQTGKWTKLTYYFKTYETTDLKSVYLKLGLGTSSNKVMGYALFDNVSIYSVDESVYNEEFAKVYQLNEDGTPKLENEKALNKQYVPHTSIEFKDAAVTNTKAGIYAVKTGDTYEVVDLSKTAYDANVKYYTIVDASESEYTTLVEAYNNAVAYGKNNKVIRYDDKVACTHEWNSETGVCDICGEKCKHTYDHGTCTTCGHADPDYVEEHDHGNELLWVYITSIIIAVVLVVVVVIVIIKKFLPKRRAKFAKASYDKTSKASKKSGAVDTSKDKYDDK